MTAEEAFRQHVEKEWGWTVFAGMHTATSGAEYKLAFIAGHKAASAPAWEGSLAQRNLADAWAAMRMIRETIETLGPIGAIPAEEHLAGPTFLHEAEAIVAGRMKMKAADPVVVGFQTLLDKVHEFGTFKIDGEDDPLSAFDEMVVPALVAGRKLIKGTVT